MIFDHTAIPFRRTPADPWSVVCLDCLVVIYNIDMKVAVAKTSTYHSGEVRFFTAMVLTPASNLMLG